MSVPVTIWPTGHHIYAVQRGEGGPVKIGRSRDFAKRLLALQNGSAERLIVVALIHAPPSLEKSLHEQHARLRLSGEWFRPDDDLIDSLRTEPGNILLTHVSVGRVPRPEWRSLPRKKRGRKPKPPPKPPGRPKTPWTVSVEEWRAAAWKARNVLGTYLLVADAIGISDRSLKRFQSGQRPAPLHVYQALLALST